MALSLRCLTQASKAVAQVVSPVSPRSLQVPKTPKTPKTPRTPNTPMTPRRQVPFGLPEEAMKRAPKVPSARTVHFDEVSLCLDGEKSSEAVQLPLSKACAGESPNTCVPTPSLAEFRTNLPVLLGRLRAQEGQSQQGDENGSAESSALAAQRAFLARQSHRQSRTQCQFVI